MDYDKKEFPDDAKELLESAVNYLSDNKTDEAQKLLDALDKADYPDAQKALQDTVKKVLGLIDAKKYDEAKAELLKLLAKYGYAPAAGTYPAPKKMVFHAAVKGISDEERIIEGFASITGMVDREGEIMDRGAFDKGINTFMQNPVLLYSHDIKKPIGKVLELAIKPAGLWIRAQVAKGTQAADEAWNLIKQEVLKAFSVGGFYEKHDNHLKRWDLTEISVCAVPTNQRALFSVAKAFEFGTDLVETKIGEYIKELEKLSKELILTENKEKANKAIDELRNLLDSDKITVESEAETIYNKTKEEVKTIMGNEKEQLVKDITESVRTQMKEEADTAATLAAEQKTHDDEVAGKAVETFKNELKEKSKGLPFEFADDARLTVGSRYDDLSTDDLAFLDQLLISAGNPENGERNKALAASVKKDIDSGYAQKMLYGVKIGEVMNTDETGYGGYWKPTLWSAVIWKQIRLAAKVAPLFPSIEMPSQPYEYPLESTGPQIFKVAEATAEAEMTSTASAGAISKIAEPVVTAKVQFNAGKLGAMTFFTEDLVEDSIIPILPQLRAQYAENMAHAIDYVILHGDELVIGDGVNISKYGAGVADLTNKILILNGLRRNALTNADKVDCGVLTVDDVSAVRAVMGTNGKYGIDATKLVLICDPATWYKMVMFDEVLTLDKMGPAATILTGQLGSIFTIPIIVSEDYPLTQADGYIHRSDDNLKGSFLIARKEGVMLGWRRHVKMTVGDVPFSDAHFILATCRFDLQFFATGMTGLGYDITV